MNVLPGHELTDLAAVAAGERDNVHVAFVGGMDRVDDIRTVAAGGNGKQHIAFAAQRADLLRENLFERVVVGDRGYGRRIGSQRDAGQAGPFHLESIEQFSGKMLRVRRRSAVAANENFADRKSVV